MPQSSLGAKILPGEQIPQDQMHAAGKAAYQQSVPKITADPGTTDYFRERQEQLDYKSQHPWGDPVSAHPGVLGKIGHVASKIGNVAGEIFAPGVMANIPGTELHNEVESAENQRGIRQGIENEAQQAGTEHVKAETAALPGEEAARQAQTEHTQAETASLEAPPPKVTFEKTEDGSIVQMTADPKSGQAKVQVVYHGDPKVETDVIQREVKGQPHNFLINKKSGADIKDLGPKKEEGAVGNWSLQEGPEGKPILFNSKTAQTKEAPAGMEAKGTADKQKKAAQPMQDVLDEIAESKEYAANPSATNDYGLLMNFIGTTKPESLAKLRLNQNEVHLATGTRGSLGDLQALAQRVENGEMLTPDQRKAMLQTMDIVGKFATRRMQQLSGGGSGETPASKATKEDPLGIR